jgi:predicted nucleic acid-binding protein
MLTEPVLIDTGPLVAYFNKRDAHNIRCASVFDDIAPPLITCWPVLTEASYLLATHGGVLMRSPVFFISTPTSGRTSRTRRLCILLKGTRSSESLPST